jgi:hypothetical protein
METVTPLMDLRLIASVNFYDQTAMVRSCNGGTSAECYATIKGEYECEYNLDDFGYQVGYALSREHLMSVSMYTQIGTGAGPKLYVLADTFLSLKDIGELLDSSAETQTVSRTAHMSIARYGRSKAASIELKLLRVKKSVYIAGVTVKVEPEDAQYIVERMALYKKQLNA